MKGIGVETRDDLLLAGQACRLPDLPVLAEAPGVEEGVSAGLAPDVGQDGLAGAVPADQEEVP